MPAYLCTKTIKQIKKLARAGLSRRAIAMELGIGSQTVKKYAGTLLASNCACGRPSSHGGWCKERALATGNRPRKDNQGKARRDRIKERKEWQDLLSSAQSGQTDPQAIVEEVHKATAQLKGEFADDIKQHLIMLRLAEKLQVEDIKDAIPILHSFYRGEFVETVGLPFDPTEDDGI